MSVPVWSTPSGSLGTVSELNFFALGLEAYDSVDPSRPLSFELVAGTPPSGVHIDSYGTIAGSPDTILRETDTNDSIARIRFKQITSKFAVRARVADYYETFTSNGNATRTQFILTQPITFDITRVLAVINDNAIITTRFKKSSTGVVTVTLNRALAAAGETLVISLYQAGAAVADRTFSMTIVGSNPPKILKFDPLGTYFDGQYVDIDITALDLDIEDTITWSLSAGQLPDGVTLDKHTGKISGFIRPYYVTDAVRTEINNLGFDDEQFDGRTYDNDAPTVTTYPILSPSTDIYSNYQFTITVSDGNKENAKSYNLRVISSSDIKVSSDQISVDDNTFTVDSKVTYSPLMKTEIGEIGPVLHDNNFMYKFDAIDYNGDTIEYFEDNSAETGFDNTFDDAAYDIGSIGLPTSARDGFDLTLDPDTGWIQGTIPVLPDLEKTYKFNIRARKKDVLATNPATGEQTYYKSRRKQFQLTISGQESVGVVWDTPANLGSMDNGAVSELEISATAQTSNTIYYELLDGSHSRLPQGLKLLDNGLLIGRTTFSTFECDAGTTTFDKKNFYISETTIDRNYSFTVRAYDVNIKTPTSISHNITNITSAGVATVTPDTYTKGQIFNITAMGTTVTGFPTGTYYVIPYIDNNGSPYYTERVTGYLETSAGSFVVGDSYIIKTVGTTNFTLIGASANTVGVPFVATGVGTGTGVATLSVVISAGSFVVGRSYIIKTVGTTDFTLIGASANTVGVTFVATGVGTGTGVATPYISIKLASTYANATAQPPVPISGVSTSAIASSTVLVTPNITYINTDGVAKVTYNTYLRGQEFHISSLTLGRRFYHINHNMTRDYMGIDESVDANDIGIVSQYATEVAINSAKTYHSNGTVFYASTPNKFYKLCIDINMLLKSVAITGTTGQFSCESTPLAVNDKILITGTLGGTGSITGYTNPKTYYINTILTETPAGSFVAGDSYTIKTVGTTDFTLIGASANTVGITFVATGVGTGTGVATPSKADAYTLSETLGGPAITTTIGTPTGIAYTRIITQSTAFNASTTFVTSDTIRNYSYTIVEEANYGYEDTAGLTIGTYYIINDVTGTRITLASSYINAMNNTPISTVTASGPITASSVIIKTIYHTVNTTKTFTLALKKAFVKPYENLYIAARLPKADRLSLSSYLENTAIIPTTNLYRPEDSNFGLAKDLRLLMANGVNPASAADYVGVISKAHYNKQLYFGKAKTARVLNNDNSVRYEIVYLDVLDDLRNSESINVTPAIDVTDNKIPFSADMDSIDVATTVTTDGVSSLYPNNLANMRRFITRTLGQVNKALPDWMTDMQEDGRVLGFTTGCVLAYVVPGTAKKIAYRLNNSDLNFNNLHVVADRYVWDNNLTRNYNKTDEKFLANELTTFDLYTEKYVPSTVSNMGAGAEFIVVSRDNLKYKEVNIVDGGNEYRVGDQITIPGSNLSGVDFVNDALITVTKVYNKKLIRDWKPHTTYTYGEPDIKYNNKVYRIRNNFTSGDTFTEMTGVTTISGTAETLGKLRDVTPLSGTAINVGKPDAITLVGGTAIPAPLQTGAPVPTIAVTGTGAGLTINISKLGTGVAYTESNTSVSIAALGGGYHPADLVKVSGAVLGGTSPANDLTIRVTDIQVTIYTSIPTLTLTGSGVGATVTVVKLGSDTTYTPDNISISVETLGIGYTAGDTLKVLGTSLGGTTPTNDLVFAVLPTESLTYSSVNTVTMTGAGTSAKVTVTKSGPPILTAVQATSIAGTFSCSDAILEVNQTVTISGTMSSSPTIPLVQITGTAGTFSCTNTTLAVGQSITISGNASNVATAPLTSVQITSTRGTFSCTPLASLTSLYVGQEITISDALAGTGSIAEYISPPATYYIIATDGYSTFTLSTSSDPTSTPLTTVAGTTTGATFTIKYGLPPIAGYVSPTTYYITATNGVNTFTLSDQINGLPIITNAGTPTGWTYTHNIISDYSNPTTYYITNTDGKNVFTLSKSRGGSPIVTMTGTPSGLIFSGTGTSYTRANTVIDITVPGKDYFTGDIIKVLGTELGGTSPANDLTFTAVARYMQPYDDGSTIALRSSANSGITVLDQQIVDGRILSATVSGLSVANGVYGSTGSPKSGSTEVQGRSFVYADGADFVEPLLAPDGITLEYPYNPRVADPESRQKGTITTFDGNSMQFFANKDAYATQDQGDAYLKWPKMNIFHMQRLS